MIGAVKKFERVIIFSPVIMMCFCFAARDH
jgi:hypothetical protein